MLRIGFRMLLSPRVMSFGGCVFMVMADSNTGAVLFKVMAKLAVVQALNDDGCRWGCYSFLLVGYSSTTGSFKIF